ncbi:MAG: hypothetical protein KDA20_11180 [Phycisphaerales bacterium]|nr:hypothetical protein [Phycisphaerales bacterium]
MMRGARAIILIALGLAMAVSARGQEVASTPEETLARAQDAFNEGVAQRQDDPGRAKAAFDKAIAGFQRLETDFDIVNGGVEYNIGNCYLMSGRVGRAIAAYRRAQHLRPGDANVQANLHVARMRVPDRFEQPAGSVIWRVLVFWRHWPAERKLVVLLVGNAALWLVLGARLVGWRVPRSVAVVGAVVAGVMAVSLWTASKDDAKRAGVVVDGAVVGRQGPGGEGEYEPSFTRALSEGVEFDVVEDRDAWLLVELGDGRQTWLERGNVEVFGGR